MNDLRDWKCWGVEEEEGGVSVITKLPSFSHSGLWDW